MDLLRRFTRGELEAFEELFRRHQPEVYQWAMCLMRDAAAAEDVTIEAFWRMYRAHARFDPTRPFGAWARRIVSNVAMEYLRKHRREAPADPELLDRQSGPAEADGAVRAEQRHAVVRAFLALPAKLRAVASLVLIEGKKYDEVARALGISMQAVKSREFRAVRSLRKRLSEMGMEP